MVRNPLLFLLCRAKIISSRLHCTIMPLKWQGYLVILGVVASALVANFVTLRDPIIDDYELAERLFAVNGFIAISFATIMTPLFRLESPDLKRREPTSSSITRLHYLLATLGLAFATAHPVSVAVRDLSPQVFLPRIESWASFLANAGRPAFFLLYIAFFVAFAHGRINRHWGKTHALMYLVLLLVIVHANLLGTDLQNPVISLLFNFLFASSIFAFFVRRVQGYRNGRKVQANSPVNAS
jgi:DMSO/TMAO reductase YedYZ heme-binding membrane subunit